MDPLDADKPSYGFTEAASQITRSGASWSQNLGQATTVTFAFRATAPEYDNGVEGQYTTFNAQQIAISLAAFQSWADVAKISFNRVGTGTTGPAAYSDNATMLLGALNNGEDYYRGFAHLPGEDGNPGDRDFDAPDGDVIINNIWDYMRQPELWNRGFLVLTHEIGHAIGLDHPGDYNRAPGENITYEEHAEFREDTAQYTVMTYFLETNTGADYKGFCPAAPQLYDIAAAQRLYGANMTTRTGDTTYGFNSTAERAWFNAASAAAPIIFCAWDAGGNDTFDFSGYGQDQLIDLGEEHFSNVGALIGNVSIAKGAVIENAVGGGGDDQLIGNAVANRLDGAAGADTLTGLAGNDTLTGGLGADRLDGGAGVDAANYSGAAAVIASLAAGTAVMVGVTDVLVAIEDLIGSSKADRLTGDGLVNALFGGLGKDMLDGGGRNDRLIGGGDADSLTGGAGADIFVFTATTDSAIGAKARDLILDLARTDRIDLSGIDADAGLAGNQAFALVDKFSGEAGELRLVYRADLGETLLQGDVDGDRKADFIIRLAGDQSAFDHFVL